MRGRTWPGTAAAITALARYGVPATWRQLNVFYRRSCPEFGHDLLGGETGHLDAARGRGKPFGRKGQQGGAEREPAAGKFQTKVWCNGVVRLESFD